MYFILSFALLYFTILVAIQIYKIMVKQIEIDFSRGRENELSKEMNAVNNQVRQKDLETVYSLIDGIRCTSEIADIMGKPINKISGRFTQLKALNRIKPIGSKQINNSKFTIYATI
jgi:hypothetical protein